MVDNTTLLSHFGVFEQLMNNKVNATNKILFVVFSRLYSVRILIISPK